MVAAAAYGSWEKTHVIWTRTQMAQTAWREESRWEIASRATCEWSRDMSGLVMPVPVPSTFGIDSRSRSDGMDASGFGYRAGIGGSAKGWAKARGSHARLSSLAEEDGWDGRGLRLVHLHLVARMHLGTRSDVAVAAPPARKPIGLKLGYIISRAFFGHVFKRHCNYSEWFCLL